MSYFDDLITQLCPDGVPFRPLSDLLDYKQPGKYLVASTSYDNSHPTPVLTAGQTFVLGYTSETDGIYPASPSSPVVIFDDFTTAFKWVDFAFKAKSSAMKMLTPNSNGSATLRFVYYAMQTIKYAPKDHARQWIATYSHFRIPVPPVEVQSEIVRILDLFQSLQIEIQEELQARQVQYSHYRATLLAFRGTEDVKRVPLGELATVRVGQAPPNGVIVDEGPFAYVNAGTSASGRAAHFNTAGGTVTIPSRGQGGVGVVGYQSEDFWCGPLCYRITSATPELRTRFVYHYLKSIQPAIRGLRQTGGTPALNRKELILVEVAVPSIHEQDRIADMLDMFDVLVNDPSIGLTAELKLRRTQYEHYRNRLLTFQEAVV